MLFLKTMTKRPVSVQFDALVSTHVVLFTPHVVLFTPLCLNGRIDVVKSEWSFHKTQPFNEITRTTSPLMLS